MYKKLFFIFSEKTLEISAQHFRECRRSLSGESSETQCNLRGKFGDIQSKEEQKF